MTTPCFPFPFVIRVYTIVLNPLDIPTGSILSLGVIILEKRYMTRGVAAEVPVWLQNLREAFGDTLLKQELAIARLLYFVEKFWPELLRFSRRTERQINRWAARYGMKLSPQEVMDSAKDSRMGRYTAVNLTNDETIEIRIFRGTLKLNTLLATLQMVNAMCDVAISLSDEELQALSWHDFLNRIHEAELIQYLKERNLYKNDPVAYEEDE